MIRLPACRRRFGSGKSSQSLDDNPGRPVLARRFQGGDRAVQKGADCVHIRPQVLRHLRHVEFAKARRKRERQEDLIGGVGVYCCIGDGFKCEKLIDGLVRDGLGGAAALAQADECRRDFAFVFSDQGDRGPLPRSGPANELDFTGEALRFEASDCAFFHALSDVTGEIRDPGQSANLSRGPRVICTYGAGVAGVITASSLPPPLG